MTATEPTKPKLLDESALLRAMVADAFGIANVVQFCRHKHVELGGDAKEWWARFLILMAADLAADDLQCPLDIPLLLNACSTALMRPQAMEGGN